MSSGGRGLVCVRRFFLWVGGGFGFGFTYFFGGCFLGFFGLPGRVPFLGGGGGLVLLVGVWGLGGGGVGGVFGVCFFFVFCGGMVCEVGSGVIFFLSHPFPILSYVLA